jgi:GNAT acetyltransferase-like protein
MIDRTANGSDVFRIEPLHAICGAWEKAAATSASAALYHEKRWLDLLSGAYGLNFSLAALREHDELLAGCLLARSRNPFAAKFVALPFSDYAPPLAQAQVHVDALLNELKSYGVENGTAFEIRGAAGPEPWKTIEFFQVWRLELSRSFGSLERGLHANFRRRIRQARAAGVRIERGRGADHLLRFYQLQLETRRRLGVPPQPLRFFQLVRKFFARDDGFEIWLATHRGRDCAAEFILRTGNVVYGKWNARRLDAVPGANHLLLWSVVEEFAGRTAVYDLGRTDVRNRGLALFKREMGCTANTVPYCYFPATMGNVSAEVAGRPRQLAMVIWRHLPVAVTRAIGRVIYRYLG